jgi:hypothetical protein
MLTKEQKSILLENSKTVSEDEAIDMVYHTPPYAKKVMKYYATNGSNRPSEHRTTPASKAKHIFSKRK